MDSENILLRICNEQITAEGKLRLIGEMLRLPDNTYVYRAQEVTLLDGKQKRGRPR